MGIKEAIKTILEAGYLVNNFSYEEDVEIFQDTNTKQVLVNPLYGGEQRTFDDLDEAINYFLNLKKGV